MGDLVPQCKKVKQMCTRSITILEISFLIFLAGTQIYTPCSLFDFVKIYNHLPIQNLVSLIESFFSTYFRKISLNFV